MSDTLMPCCVKRGISFSISVVLPLPDQPAKPKVFMRAAMLHQHHLAARDGKHRRQESANDRIGESPAAVFSAQPTADQRDPGERPSVGWEHRFSRDEARGESSN